MGLEREFHRLVRLVVSSIWQNSFRMLSPGSTTLEEKSDDFSRSLSLSLVGGRHQFCFLSLSFSIEILYIKIYITISFSIGCW